MQVLKNNSLHMRTRECGRASTAVAHRVAQNDSLTALVNRMRANICSTENKSSLNEGLKVNASTFCTESSLQFVRRDAPPCGPTLINWKSKTKQLANLCQQHVHFPFVGVSWCAVLSMRYPQITSSSAG